MNTSAPPTRSPARLALGVAAIAVLLALAVSLPAWSHARHMAVVEASRTFSLTSVSPGSHEWSLRDGLPARGQALVRQRVLQFERSDLVEMDLEPGLSTGDEIAEGQVLARVQSPRDRRRLEEFRSLQRELEAQKALLRAGARPEEVEAARRELALARAAWEGAQPQLSRARSLSAEGVLSETELEGQEVQDRLLALQVEVAQAALDVARASARPEAIEAVEAQMDAVAAQIAELEARMSGEEIRSPIAGLLELGGNRVVLRVYALDPVYLRIPLPQADRHAVSTGTAVEFTTAAVPQQVFRGEIVDVGEDASDLNGVQVFWASARVENPDRLLRSGMTGIVRMPMASASRSFPGWLRDVILGYGP